MRRLLVSISILPLFLGGCIVGTAADIVTAPVKVAGKGIDAVTTSQSEADEKRGRKLREHEKRLGQLTKERNREARKCEKGSSKACKKADKLEEDIDDELARKI